MLKMWDTGLTCKAHFPCSEWTRMFCSECGLHQFLSPTLRWIKGEKNQRKSGGLCIVFCTEISCELLSGYHMNTPNTPFILQPPDFYMFMSPLHLAKHMSYFSFKLLVLPWIMPCFLFFFLWLITIYLGSGRKLVVIDCFFLLVVQTVKNDFLMLLSILGSGVGREG